MLAQLTLQVPNMSIKIPKDMRLVEVPGDGNCYFHSLAEATGIPHDELRGTLAAYIEGMSDDEWSKRFTDFLQGELCLALEL